MMNCRLLLTNFVFPTLTRSYAVKAVPTSAGLMGLGKGKKGVGVGPATVKPVLTVEKDINTLVNYVCGSNIYITGEDVKLKPDEEYPEWLWSMRVGAPPKLSDMDPNSKVYWKRVRALGIRRNNALRKFMHR